MGRLYVVGFGCGSREGLTLEAAGALSSSDIIVGYTTYTGILKEFYPEKPYISTGMRSEAERVEIAIKEALSGKTVSLICSGDPVIYGLAGLVFELNEKRKKEGGPVSGCRDGGSAAVITNVSAPEKSAGDDIEIVVIPGVTAALGSGALLGAPLTCDFAVISLSDILTPADSIEKRLRAAALGDFNIVLYNPSSRHRPDHLRKAVSILLEYRAPDTVCGYARNTGREGEEHGIMTLMELKDFSADMFTTVFVGSSATRVIDGRMVTPRGYRNV